MLSILNNTVVSTDRLPLKNEYPLINEEFGRYLSKCFDLNLESGPWLAGGIVRKMYTNCSLGSSDWDIFFNNVNQLGQCLPKFIEELKPTLVAETENALTYQVKYNGSMFSVQLIVKKFYKDVNDLFSNFDFSICQLATDGKNIKLGQHTAKDLKNKTIRQVGHIKPDTILYRLIKYTILGFKPTTELYDIMLFPETEIKWTFNYVTYDDI